MVPEAEFVSYAKAGIEMACVFRDYEMVVPDAPGFGTQLDEDKLRFYTRK